MSDEKIMYICIVLLNSISIAGCIFVITVYFLAKDLRVYAFTLVSYLATIDLLKSSSMLLPTYRSDSSEIICQVQAIVLQFFSLASIFMTTLMASTLYLNIVAHYENIENMRYYSIGLVILLSIIGTFIPVYYNAYGYDDV